METTDRNVVRPARWVRWTLVGGLAGLTWLWLLVHELRLMVLHDQATLLEKHAYRFSRERSEVLQVLRSLAEQEQPSLEAWEQALVTCGYQAMAYVVTFDEFFDVLLGRRRLLLAEVTDETAPWYPVGGGGHYQTIIDCHRDKVFLVDHARQVVTPQAEREFLAQWTGKLLVLQPLE